jgi:hypothetical protein
MIQINSFIPTDNFTRRIWEFHEDKIVVKIKSLTVDVENEIRYEKIKSISTKKIADLNWLWITFFIYGVLSVTTLGLGSFDLMNPTLRVVEKVIAAIALLFALPSFRKHEFYCFGDSEKYHLASIKINNDEKRAQITEAINLIKKKTEIVSEIYLNDSLPNTNPMFEIVEFDFPDFLNTSTTRFYDNKVIETHKSLVEEIARVTKYNEFNGKTKTARVGNNNWNYVWCYWMLFVCIIGFSISTFFAKQIGGNYLFGRLFFGSLALLVPLYFLKYIKSEFLVFNDKNDEGILEIGVNKKNREKLNHIVEFIKGKVETQNQKPA